MSTKVKQLEAEKNHLDKQVSINQKYRTIFISNSISNTTNILSYFLFIPYLIFEGYPAGGHDLSTFCTFGCKLLLKTSNTIHIRIVGNNKRFASYLLLADHTLKTFVVPFFGFVLHLLHSRTKCFPTSITSTRKLSIVARGTKDKSILGGKRFVY